MKKPFDLLFNNLQKSLNDLERRSSGPDRYSAGIYIITGQLRELRVMSKKHMAGRAAEVEYFRYVWPAFFGLLLLYIRQYRFELARVSRPVRALSRMIRQEERTVTDFFRIHREFWMYCRAGSAELDDEFTRKYSQARVFDPLALVIDQEGATLASYRAAWCWAMERYMSWLMEKRDELMTPVGIGPGTDYTWDPTDADYVEWLNGLFAVKAIRYKGEPADLSRLAKWGKWALGKEVANIYDRFKVIRSRKKDRMPFTKKTANALETRMDQAEGKFE